MDEFLKAFKGLAASWKCRRMQDFAQSFRLYTSFFSRAILECGGRAKRRHRFERFTPAVWRASLKAVSPVADAPYATALQNKPMPPHPTLPRALQLAQMPAFANCKMQQAQMHIIHAKICFY